MWLMTVYGFYSVACFKNRKGEIVPDIVMVRARKHAHLSALQRRFPQIKDRKIQKWPGRDYGFRLVMPKRLWAQLVGEMVMEQDWSNFKGAASAKNTDRAYNGALHAVWGTMLELQEGKPWWKTFDPPDNEADLFPAQKADSWRAQRGYKGSAAEKEARLRGKTAKKTSTMSDDEYNRLFAASGEPMGLRR